MTQPVHGSDHAYLSTACMHAITAPDVHVHLHDDCRTTCKWCGNRCQCTCHIEGVGADGDRAG